MKNMVIVTLGLLVILACRTPENNSSGYEAELSPDEAPIEDCQSGDNTFQIYGKTAEWGTIKHDYTGVAKVLENEKKIVVQMGCDTWDEEGAVTGKNKLYTCRELGSPGLRKADLYLVDDEAKAQIKKAEMDIFVGSKLEKIVLTCKFNTSMDEGEGGAGDNIDSECLDKCSSLQSSCYALCTGPDMEINENCLLKQQCDHKFESCLAGCRK